MSNLSVALSIEWLKLRRSRVPLVTGVVTLVFPLVGGLFMLILKDPEWARRMGLLAAKAEITAGTADWPGYFALLAQMAAAGGFFIFGLVLVWAFGREFANGTAKDLLALPTPREAIVAAKLVACALWALVLAVIMVGLGVATGIAVGLPGWSDSLATAAISRLAVGSLLTILLVWPFALAASAGRGYLPPFGFMLLTLALSQILNSLGYGAYFPWAIPALYSMGEPGVGAASVALALLVSLAGAVATIAWWRYADQT